MKRIEKRLEGQKKKKRKLIIGSSVLMTAFFLSSTIAFADADINGLITSWYNKKVEIAKDTLSKALNSELATQKARLRKELEDKLEASSTEIDNYTKQEIEVRRQAILKHADKLIKDTNFSNDADKAQIKSKLDNILNESIKAMNNLKDSYKPPVETYTPTPIQEASNKDNNSKDTSANNIKEATAPQVNNNTETQTKSQSK